MEHIEFWSVELFEPVHPMTSMKFIRFFHDSHIFHRLTFNKHYSRARTHTHLFNIRIAELKYVSVGASSVSLLVEQHTQISRDE